MEWVASICMAWDPCEQRGLLPPFAGRHPARSDHAPAMVDQTYIGGPGARGAFAAASSGTGRINGAAKQQTLRNGFAREAGPPALCRPRHRTAQQRDRQRSILAPRQIPR
jgi:hypothetical protein